jgi:hypothetical protein
LNFLSKCVKFINCNDRTNELNEKPSTNTYCKWVFFTTNYDNILEEYWINFRKYTNLDLGFYDNIDNRRRICILNNL